ncbi:MAG: aminopeptidase P family protein [Clostridia bacterium]|nr:aminopeptidase P family protein [Clostridia bacterium]
MNQERLARVLARMKENNLPQMVLNDPSTMEYILEYPLEPLERMYAIVLSTEREPVLLLNDLFVVPDGIPMKQVRYFDTDDSAAVLARYLDPNEVCGVEKVFPAKLLLPLQDTGAVARFVNGSPIVDTVRACKSADEAQKMRVCSLINDAVMDQLPALIKEGMTELELGAIIKELFLKEGADRSGFAGVAFGANAADPHHRNDNTALKPGDCVLIDMGCVKDGYWSDMTRTFFFKTVSDRQREVYELVRAANEKAESIIKPGVRFCEIDAAARDLITEGGFGPRFIHRLGHSIGLEDHEAGDVSSANPDPVLPGMTFSIEPGIYLTGEFGVRIEDLVLITEDGCEILNHNPKDLIVIE